MAADTRSSADSTVPTRRPRRGTGGVTLHEVARIAKVSPTTASRALNAPDQVAAATPARVREAVESTGYVPNMLAGSLASSRSRLVAGVLPTVVGPVFPRAEDGAHTMAFIEACVASQTRGTWADVAPVPTR